LTVTMAGVTHTMNSPDATFKYEFGVSDGFEGDFSLGASMPGCPFTVTDMSAFHDHWVTEPVSLITSQILPSLTPVGIHVSVPPPAIYNDCGPSTVIITAFLSGGQQRGFPITWIRDCGPAGSTLHWMPVDPLIGNIFVSAGGAPTPVTFNWRYAVPIESTGYIFVVAGPDSGSYVGRSEDGSVECVVPPPASLLRPKVNHLTQGSCRNLPGTAVPPAGGVNVIIPLIPYDEQEQEGGSILRKHLQPPGIFVRPK
jgi:hypothetical protein